MAHKRNRLKRLGLTVLRDLDYVTHLQPPTLFHRYEYQFSPAQLAFLCSCIDRTASVDGAIVEIGVADGCTTVFLNKHVSASDLDKPYVAIDTFSGFTDTDVRYEQDRRGKTGSFDAFRTNRKRWFDRTMSINGITRVRSYESDAAAFDYERIGPISFALIDVDLYLPVRSSLARVWPVMAPGGLIVVDDCKQGSWADGAYQAYREFSEDIGIEPRVELGGLGVLEKRGET